MNEKKTATKVVVGSKIEKEIYFLQDHYLKMDFQLKYNQPVALPLSFLFQNIIMNARFLFRNFNICTLNSLWSSSSSSSIPANMASIPASMLSLSGSKSKQTWRPFRHQGCHYRAQNLNKHGVHFGINFVSIRLKI